MNGGEKMEDMKSVTQISISIEQRELANKIPKFSTKLCEAMEQYFDEYISTKTDSNKYQGQKIAKFTSNKSISISCRLRQKLDDLGINASNYARWLIDNKLKN
jgi:hypothetical protein